MSFLKHPNVCQLSGICLTPLMIATEFVGCGDLYGYIHNAEKELPFPLVLKIAIDIAAGMAFMHNTSPPLLRTFSLPSLSFSPSLLTNTSSQKNRS